MTTVRQTQANRRNALMSTGPRTEQGKRRSRRNALRHGLTAETVIEPLEDAAEYQSFEASIVRHYSPQTAVERELVFRLASLMWRIRRATALETGLLQIQAETFRDQRREFERKGKPEQVVMGIGEEDQGDNADDGDDADDGDHGNHTDDHQRLRTTTMCPVVARRELTWSFLRLAHVDEGALERLTRYEGIIWRQIAQTILLLDSMRRR
jgi:hypothetical protein